MKRMLSAHSSRVLVDNVSHFQRALIHSAGACQSVQRDYYALLGISEDANREEIKKAFHVDFQVDAMEKFIEESTIPIVTLWTSDPNSHTYARKLFNGGNDKAMLFVNFSIEHDAFQSIYKDVAASYKGKDISFLMVDIDVGQGAFQMNVERI